MENTENCGPFTFSKNTFYNAIAAAMESLESGSRPETDIFNGVSMDEVLRGEFAAIPSVTESEVNELIFQTDPIALGKFLLCLRMIDIHDTASRVRAQLANCVINKYGYADFNIATFIADQWLFEIELCVFQYKQSRESERV
ncbi:MAG: hypothetical protein SFV81_17800 [Pirellulaceae bacterium]|nr:hypothetical protein [Pirellulaceae bacterium]